MVWNKETERFLNDYQNGKIPKMKEDLESLLSPFDFNNVENIADDWQKLHDYELKIEDYNLIALDVGNNADSTVFKEALKDVLFINERIKAKKDFAKDVLEKAVIEYQDEFSKHFDENDLVALQEGKDVLRKISTLAKSIEYTDLLQQTTNLESLSEKKIARLLEEENNRKEKRLSYDSVVSDAENNLQKKSSKDDLLEGRQEIYALSLLDDSDNPFIDREKINTLLSDYDDAVKQKTISSKRKRVASVAAGLGLVALLGASYFSYGILKDKREALQEKLALEKELNISVLAQKKDSYAASVDALEKERSSLSSQIEEKKGEYASLSLQFTKKKDDLDELVQKQSLLTPTSSKTSPTKTATPYEKNTSQVPATTSASKLVDHLAPLLEDATFTLYVEKESNQTYVLENTLTGYNVHGPFSHSDAANPARKTMQGQKSTPEGVYEIVSFTHFGDAKEAPFGRGFWKINYPNEKDVQENCTGGGVGVCSAADYSVERAINAGRDVMHSGVAVQDNSFEKIRSIIGDGGSTQVVIENYARRPLAELR